MLTGNQIASRIEYNDLAERRNGGEFHVGPCSLDVHLAPEITYLEPQFHEVAVGLQKSVDVTDPESYPTTRTKQTNTIEILPGEFVLGATDERFDFGGGLSALLHGRSSIGRLGLFIENAGLVDRGFSGTLTLELYNPTDYTIEIPAYTRVGQLIFFEHDANRDDPGYDGKYNGQEDPTASRLHQDFPNND